MRVLRAGQAAAVQRLAAVEGGRDLGGGDGQGVEEAAQCLGGAQRVGGPEAAQVDIELPAGEPAGVLVRPVHGQRGLTHPGRPADRTSTEPGGARGQRRQRAQFACPAGETGHRGRQHRRARPRAAGRAPPAGRARWLRVPRRLAAARCAALGHGRCGRRRCRRPRPWARRSAASGSDCRMRWFSSCRPGPGSTPSSSTSRLPGLPVGGQRRGLLSGPVQRQHQQLVHPLPQRLGGRQRGELGDHLAVTAQVQVGVDPRIPVRRAASRPAAAPPRPAAGTAHRPAAGRATAPAPRQAGSMRSPTPRPAPRRVPAAWSSANCATSSSPRRTAIRYPAGRLTIRSYPAGPSVCRSRMM